MHHPLAADLDHVLDHTAGAWDGLRGERIFVTGGTGFFGKWLLESLAWANARLGLSARACVLTRDPGTFAASAPRLAGNAAFTFVQGDIRDFTFPDGTFSHVIHAATESSTTLGRDHPRAMFDTVVDGTRRVLDFATSHGTRRLLLTSSGAVYGRQPPGVTHVHEEFAGGPDPLEASSSYGEGKRAAELLCRLAASATLAPTVARCFAFVGPYLPLDAHFAVGNFLRDAVAGRPIEVRGDGTPRRSYLHAADLAAWLWTLLARGASCRAYNVGSEHDVSIAELAFAVAAAAGTQSDVRIAGIPAPGRPAERYVPSARRARDDLGLDAWIGLGDALARTLAFLRAGG